MAFTLGLLVTVAALAAFGAVRMVGSITDATESSALELYLDDRDSTTIDIGGYAIDFPDDPDKGPVRVPVALAAATDTVAGTRWQEEPQPGTTFEAVVLERSAPFPDQPNLPAATLARAIIEGYAAQVKGEASDVESVEPSDVLAWEATVKYGVRRPKRETITALVRVYIVDDTVYVARVSASLPGGQRAGFARFTKSFTPVEDTV